MIEPDAHHPTRDLSDDVLLAELGRLYAKRLDTLRHGSDDAWANSDRRVAELEGEYLRRYPDREVQADRLRPGS